MLMRSGDPTSNWKYNYEKCRNNHINNGAIVVQALSKSGKRYVQVSLISWKSPHQCLQCQPVTKQNWLSIFYSAQQWLYYKPTPSFITTNQKSLTIYGQDYYCVVPLKMLQSEILWDGSAHRCRCLCKHWDFSINHLTETFDPPVGFEYHISDCYSNTFALCDSGYYVIVIKEQTSALRLFPSYITLMRQILWETQCKWVGCFYPDFQTGEETSGVDGYSASTTDNVKTACLHYKSLDFIKPLANACAYSSHCCMQWNGRGSGFCFSVMSFLASI